MFKTGHCRAILIATIGILSVTNATRATAQQVEMRMVIATNVACRAEPDTGSRAVLQYALGDVFFPHDASNTEDGGWYLDTARLPGASRGCWIYGSLTTEWSNREHALLAAANHILDRGDQPPFEDYVAVINLLDQTTTSAHSDSTVLELSPLLQLRRVQVLEQAARAPGVRRRSVRQDPLKSAWFFAHREVLRYHEPAGRWMVAAERYWRLFERHRDTAWAEQIAWAAARGAVPGDVCDATCVLGRLRRTYARYWLEFPSGRWVGEALLRAEHHAASGARAGCIHSTAEEARRSADWIRASLADVTLSGKEQLLARIDEIIEACAGP